MSLTTRLCQIKSRETLLQTLEMVSTRFTQFMSFIGKNCGTAAGLVLLARSEGLPEEVFAGGFAIALWKL